MRVRESGGVVTIVYEPLSHIDVPSPPTQSLLHFNNKVLGPLG